MLPKKIYTLFYYLLLQQREENTSRGTPFSAAVDALKSPDTPMSNISIPSSMFDTPKKANLKKNKSEN